MVVLWGCSQNNQTVSTLESSSDSWTTEIAIVEDIQEDSSETVNVVLRYTGDNQEMVKDIKVTLPVGVNTDGQVISDFSELDENAQVELEFVNANFLGSLELTEGIDMTIDWTEEGEEYEEVIPLNASDLKSE